MKLNLRTLSRFAAASAFSVGLAGCASHETMHTQTVPNADYRAALEATDPAKHELPPPGSAEETAMLDRVRDLFENYTRANLEANVSKVYAEDVYFRDAFKQFSDPEAIRDYLVEGLEPLEQIEFRLRHIARADGEFYIDWLMRLDFKKTPSGSWEESIGMTHMRFNNEGRVILHQDYWDPTDIVYRRIPIARSLIAYVKKKL